MTSITANQKTVYEQQAAMDTLKSKNLFKNYFDMPVWQLRHMEVSNFIRKNSIKHILDIGCAEGTLINRLSRSSQIQNIIGIDFDMSVLNNAKNNVEPELLQQSTAFYRVNPLKIQLYHLNVLQNLPFQKFKDIQLITIIQFIEHIKLQDLPILCDKVFKKIKPKYVTITTPNQQFNIHFNFKPKQMRHPDHLFQWNRKQFQIFCQQIQNKYGYKYQIFGVGEHVSEDKYGLCSQGAHFTRIIEQNNKLYHNLDTINSGIQPVFEVRYPFWQDNLQSKIQNQLTSRIIKNNYQTPAQIAEIFKQSSIYKKIISTWPEQQSKFDANWVIEKAISLKYCGYCKQNDYIFYEYLDSSFQEEQQFEDYLQNFKEQACSEQVIS